MQMYFRKVGSLRKEYYIFTCTKKYIITAYVQILLDSALSKQILVENLTLRQLCYNVLFTVRFNSYLLFFLICMS